MTSGPVHEHPQPASAPRGGEAEVAVASDAPAPREYTLRRAPRLGAVVVSATLLGLPAALVATLIARSGEPLVDPYSGAPLTFGSTFGFMAFACCLAAAVLGLCVWLLLDRRSRRAERTVLLERTDDPASADVGLTRAAAEDLRGRLDAPAGSATPTSERTADR
ncbi:hypothetical protein [Micrococcus sp.]|uniref:hypothetical protein n=1 Tax=Micrococcus sp. TaxID=1271 RepID=UPI002A9137B9|nr:hypothetical protein [Micrococcus sp.]MDY6055273.1 hypothetical protein [Micrococcus sp.]